MGAISLPLKARDVRDGWPTISSRVNLRPRPTKTNATDEILVIPTDTPL